MCASLSPLVGLGAWEGSGLGRGGAWRGCADRVEPAGRAAWRLHGLGLLPGAEQRQRGVSEASGAVSTRGDEATRSGLLHAPAQGMATGSALHPRALFTGRSSDPQRVWRRGL